MKQQGALVNRIVMLLFFAAILLYFGGAAWRGLRDPYPTYPAVAYEVDETVEATGYLAREETVLTGSGGIVRILPGEGEKVPVGATVALIYADQTSMEQSGRLESLEAEAGQISAAIALSGQSGQEGSGQGAAEALTALRTSVAAGDLTGLEEQTLAFKSAIYRQIQHGDTTDLQAALSSVQEEIAALRAQTARSTGSVTVSESGIFSGEVDGYETVLTPDTLESLTPSALDGLEGQAAGTGGIGKLITDSTWYFVCPLSEEDAGRLTEGGTVTVRFSRDWSGEVDMKVERIGAPENGRVAVILSSRKFLSDTTLLRRQTVEMVFARNIGLRVPTEAVRVEDGQSVVYVLVGIRAESKAVNILAQGEDYYLVEPALAEDATQKQEKKALRAGDQVIVAAREIWDGMLIE